MIDTFDTTIDNFDITELYRIPRGRANFLRNGYRTRVEATTQPMRSSSFISWIKIQNMPQMSKMEWKNSGSIAVVNVFRSFPIRCRKICEQEVQKDILITSFFSLISPV